MIERESIQALNCKVVIWKQNWKPFTFSLPSEILNICLKQMECWIWLTNLEGERRGFIDDSDDGVWVGVARVADTCVVSFVWERDVAHRKEDKGEMTKLCWVCVIKPQDGWWGEGKVVLWISTAKNGLLIIYDGLIFNFW